MLEKTLAQKHDRDDPLAQFRDHFAFPKTTAGKDVVYFCGHSLGLQPKKAAQYVEQELANWANLAVAGHFDPAAAWMDYHETVTEPLAQLTGSTAQEVVAMNSLTTNLHLLMVSFYRPSNTRYKILIEAGAFSSDQYALAAQVRFHGYDPKNAIIALAPRVNETTLCLQDIAHAIEQHGHEIALVFFPGVQYYTGQYFDIAEIVRLAHQQGCLAGFDLAHAIGNVVLHLHDWHVDFAMWCHYKYCNSGPGAVGGAFVHERHVNRPDIPRFSGWWGHDKKTRFNMGDVFIPIPSAEAWQLSNPPILSLAAVRGALSVFMQAGGMQPLRDKSVALTAFLTQCCQNHCADLLDIITPEHPQRGAQISLRFKGRNDAKMIHDKLLRQGFICDYRQPDVIRVAPVPLYCRFQEVYEFVLALKILLSA